MTLFTWTYLQLHIPTKEVKKDNINNETSE